MFLEHRFFVRHVGVLEGELKVQVGENTFRVEANSLVHLPKDIQYACQNIGTGLARSRTLMVMSGLEKLFEQVGTPGTDLSRPPSFEEDLDKLLAVASKIRRSLPDSRRI